MLLCLFSGHMEALKLITSNKFSEKNAVRMTCNCVIVCALCRSGLFTDLAVVCVCVLPLASSQGYMTCAILWNENTEFLRLLVQSVRKDLQPTNEIYQCLALSFIANIGGNEFAEGLAQDVQKLLISGKSRSFVRKKSALCLLRLFRKNPECIPLHEDNFPSQLLNLLDDPNIGVCTSVMSLLLGLVSHAPQGFEGSVEKVILLLSKLVFSKEKRSIYRYYLTLCPWLQVKCLRLLQYFPPPSATTVLTGAPADAPPADRNLMARLNHVLNDILTKTSITKNVNKNNADHSILFEAINVIIHYCTHGIKDMQGAAIGLLGRFISIREPNFRYLGLDTMTKLANVSGSLVAIKKHQEVIQSSLQDPDVSIRKRGLDLLYVMCDKSNSTEIVNHLVTYLATATFEMREELVLKIAILAEKFATDLRWYIDVILQLIQLAGDFVTEDIWYRVVQIVTNNEDLQDYAASTCFKFLNTQPHIHENGIKVGAYILGEFGDQISDKSLTGQQIFDVLQSKFKTSSNTTKALLLSAYVKFANTYPELKAPIGAVLDYHRTYVDAEIQQRACEYFVLNTEPHAKLMESVFDVMPNYSERESLLLKRIKKGTKSATTDRDVWGDKSEEGKPKNEEKAKKDDDDDDSDTSEEEEEESDSSSEEESSDDSSDDSDDEKKQPGAKPKTMDLLGGFGGAAPAAAAPSSAASSGAGGVGAAVSFPPQSSDVVQSLLGKDSGVLYETRDLQVGMKLNVENNNSVKMVFYYGNRLPNTIKDVTATLPEHEAYKMQVRPIEPFEVAPKKQVMHFFLVQVFKPFKGPINVDINFTYLAK